MNALLHIGKALTWLSIIDISVALILVIICGCANASFDAMDVLYKMFFGGIGALFVAALLLAAVPERTPGQ